MQCWAPRLLLNLPAYESQPPTNTVLTCKGMLILYVEVELLVLDTKTIASVPQKLQEGVNLGGVGAVSWTDQCKCLVRSEFDSLLGLGTQNCL